MTDDPRIDDSGERDESAAQDQRRQMMEHENTFARLAALNVNDHLEKKGNLSYLSWAWAVDQLLRHDPEASWSYDPPTSWGGDTMMVHCRVRAFGRERAMQLPVMDNRNKPIAQPDAFAVNTAMQRCLVKCIALHGIGLYVYAGEDLPLAESGDAAALTDLEYHALQSLRAAAFDGTEPLKAAWKKLDAKVRDRLAGELAGLKEAAAKTDAARKSADAPEAQVA